MYGSTTSTSGYWPNNRSRMYVMENTGDFVKKHNLQNGDYFIIYKEESTGKYIACGKKVFRPAYGEDSELQDHTRVEVRDCDHNDLICPVQAALVQHNRLSGSNKHKCFCSR